MSYELTGEQVEKIRATAFEWEEGETETRIRFARVVARAIAEPLAERIKVLEDALDLIEGVNNGDRPAITDIVETLRGGKRE